MCDETGKLRWCNASARKLFSGMRIGEIPAGALGRAVAQGAARFRADVDGRRLSGRRVADSGLSVGRTTWLVREEGDGRGASSAVGREHATFLAEAGRTLGASLHLGRTVRAVVEAPVPMLADTAVVFTPLPGARAAWYRTGPDRATGSLTAAEVESASPLARTLHDTLTEPTRCARSELAGLEEALAPWQDDEGEALVTTLPGAGAPSGVLLLAREARRPGFDAADIELVGEFAAQAGMALAAAAQYTEQADTTAALHDELTPDALPQISGVRLAAAYRPAHEGLQLSGDFYHVRPGAAGAGADFVFGDVCGSGVQAAVIAGRVRRSLRSLAMIESRPIPILRHLNEILLQDATTPFATLVFGSARPTPDGGLDVVMAGGGHLPPLVLRANGRVEQVDVGGTLVGALPEAEFEQAALKLAAGELVLLYSDGITEARGGPADHEMYGERRLIRDLATCAGMPAGAVAERIDLLLGQWLAGRPHDDLALLVIQAPPVPTRRTGSVGASPAP